MDTYIQVITTVNDRDAAEKIAREVLTKKLAACVQIFPCHSLYRWQGEIEEAGEHICIMKSSRGLFLELEQEILKMHPYDVPEILAVDVAAGNRGYLDWLDQELKPSGRNKIMV